MDRREDLAPCAALQTGLIMFSFDLLGTFALTFKEQSTVFHKSLATEQTSAELIIRDWPQDLILQSYFIMEIRNMFAVKAKEVLFKR